MQDNYLTPAEIAQKCCDAGQQRAQYKTAKQLVLSIMSGIFVALACQGTNQAVHTIESGAIAKMISGMLFPCALILIIITGSELFTGNCLMIVSCVKKRITVRSMLKSWLVVYLGNFAGSLIIAVLIVNSGQLNFTNGALGGYTINIAVYKTTMGLTNAFIMGILCNILVCAAVWIAAAAKDITGKILAILFPIWLFVASGFEHSIANMYYIPAGILAKSNEKWVSQALLSGVTQEQLASLNIESFLLNNLLPVTLGNMIGGIVVIGLVYCFVYLRN